MSGIQWEHLEHGSDIGVRGCGGDLAEAFAGAVLAMPELPVYRGSEGRWSVSRTDP